MKDYELSAEDKVYYGSKLRALIKMKKHQQKIIGVDVFDKPAGNTASTFMKRFLNGEIEQITRSNYDSILKYIGATWEELEDVNPFPEAEMFYQIFLKKVSLPDALIKKIWPKYKEFSDAYEANCKTGNKDLIKATIKSAADDLANIAKNIK